MIHGDQLIMHKRSLNSEVRKKELMKITIENQLILRRLQDKTSNYSVYKWEEDFKETEKRMKSMCEYPFALFTDPNAKYRSESRGEGGPGGRFQTTEPLSYNGDRAVDSESLLTRGTLPRIGTGVSGQRSGTKSFSTLNGGGGTEGKKVLVK